MIRINKKKYVFLKKPDVRFNFGLAIMSYCILINLIKFFYDYLKQCSSINFLNQTKKKLFEEINDVIYISGSPFPDFMFIQINVYIMNSFNLKTFTNYRDDVLKYLKFYLFDKNMMSYSGYLNLNTLNSKHMWSSIR